MSKHLNENQLTSYVYRTLTDTQRETMDIHLGACQDCRARLGEHQALHRRARYSILDRRREASKSSHANFAAVAPRLRRLRRMAMFWRGSRHFVFGAATLVALVLLVVGLVAFFGYVSQSLPAAPGPTPTPTPSIRVEDLTGIWQHPSGMYLKLNEDGTYRLAMVVAWLETLPSELGRFELEGTTFTFITSDESPGCTTGQTGSYQVELPEQGKLRFVPLQEDPCQWRADNAPVTWERVGPSLVPGTYVSTITQEDSSNDSIIGTWELTLADDNRWNATHSGSVVAEGRYSLTPDQIVFTHEKGPYTHTCTNMGAETGTYKWAFDGGALTLTTVEDECADRNKVWTAHPWPKMKLPPGTYVTTITQEDFLAGDDLNLDARTILLGEWEMTLTEGSRYSHDEVTESGQIVVAEEGPYSLTRDQIVFTAEAGSYACIGPPGVYQWALDGKTLTLTTVEDPCPERNTLNSAHPWIKQD